MNFFEIIITYFSRSSFITFLVLGWLSLYFILSLTILFSRLSGINSWHKKEQESLENLIMGATRPTVTSCLSKCANEKLSQRKLNICLNLAEKRVTSGLSWLSIIASTSPFIGLFGTVVSILDTFAGLGNGANSSLGVIAPAISEALVATAAGIFVAIPAYTFNILLKRKAYELMGVLDRQVELLIEQDTKIE